MKVFIGSDHAAFSEKAQLKEYLAQSYDLVDCGPDTNERCDYPDFAANVAKQVQANHGVGILLCGSGIGVSMVANRFSGVRAALCRSEEDAMLSRQHNNSNIICVGARTNSLDEIKKMIDTWFATAFEEGRHTARIKKFNSLGEGA